jgi:hypothetical protein
MGPPRAQMEWDVAGYSHYGRGGVGVNRNLSVGQPTERRFRDEHHWELRRGRRPELAGNPSYPGLAKHSFAYRRCSLCAFACSTTSCIAATAGGDHRVERWKDLLTAFGQGTLLSIDLG